MVNMTLTCGGFVGCERGGNKYTLKVGDSNYFFLKCSTMLVKCRYGEEITDINQVIRDPHFEFEVNGETLTKKFIPNQFTFKEISIGQYWFDCELNRPSVLTINEENPESSVATIKLVFHSDTCFESVQFYLESAYIGNYKKSDKETPKPMTSGGRMISRFWSWFGY